MASIVYMGIEILGTPVYLLTGISPYFKNSKAVGLGGMTLGRPLLLFNWVCKRCVHSKAIAQDKHMFFILICFK
ncbi:MAG: hypothetical protein GKR88_08575 [Flavobacteriaceae bacterium]|nr:MAG: hypothetical protein GKR88_08575 [Flavobacteriaceae bacterium]